MLNSQSITGLNIACWNARGIMPGSLYLDHLLTKHCIDVCCISAHWLFPHSLNFLGSINSKYEHVAVSEEDLINPFSSKINYHRGKGGFAILWNKCLSYCVSNIDLNDDRIIGIDVKIQSDVHSVIFSVYFPCRGMPTDMYNEYIQKLSDIHAQFSTYARVLFLGDMNVQIKGPRFDLVNDTRVRTISSFLHDTQMLSINVQELCSGPRFTFQPYDSAEKRTMIDHVIAPLCLSDLFTSCEIADDHELNTSDHRPIISHII